MSQNNFKFSGNGKAKILDTPVISNFIETCYAMPIYLQIASSVVSSLMQNNYTTAYQPIVFDYPKIYLIADSLALGKYTVDSKIIDDEKITNYLIDYVYNKELLKLKLTVILNINTNYTYYNVPTELTYNSINQASVVLTPTLNGFYGIINIPKNFVNLPNSKNSKNENSYKLPYFIDREPEKKILSVRISGNMNATEDVSCGIDCCSGDNCCYSLPSTGSDPPC